MNALFKYAPLSVGLAILLVSALFFSSCAITPPVRVVPAGTTHGSFSVNAANGGLGVSGTVQHGISNDLSAYLATTDLCTAQGGFVYRALKNDGIIPELTPHLGLCYVPLPLPEELQLSLMYGSSVSWMPDSTFLLYGTGTMLMPLRGSEYMTFNIQPALGLALGSTSRRMFFAEFQFAPYNLTKKKGYEAYELDIASHGGGSDKPDRYYGVRVGIMF